MSAQSIAILALILSTSSQAINFIILIKKITGSKVRQVEKRLGRKPRELNTRVIHVEDIEEIKLKPPAH
jgi:hypothetical protein